MPKRGSDDRCEVLVIGGGASGMMAAITAADRGRNVVIIEKNEKLGKKLFITGKGRCNLTNACPENEIYDHIVTNSKFMYSSIKRFGNTDTMDFFEGLGLKLKTERGGRVFPASDHSSDVIRALENRIRALGVGVRLHNQASRLLITDGKCTGAVVSDKNDRDHTVRAESVIVACGGLSYPLTGSTGDGYRFAKDAGLRVEDIFPSLVPFNIRGDICRNLQGLSLKNVRISVTDGVKSLYKSKEVGEMLFTHFGVSGPMILTASSEIRPLDHKNGLILHIDLKPALSLDELDARIQRDFKEASNKEYKNSLGKLLPAKMIPVIVALSGIDPYKKVNAITREERMRLVSHIKDFQLETCGARGFDEAIITRGGVSVKEIDPRSFEAKKVCGLYFVGEVLDVDAHTGGFNLQIAWSTGYAAGCYA